MDRLLASILFFALFMNSVEARPEDALERAMKLGAAASAWLLEVNRHRPESMVLDLTETPQSSIDHPVFYNREIAEKVCSEAEKSAPAEFVQALVRGSPLPATFLGLTQEAWILHIRSFLACYDYAKRWLDREPRYYEFISEARHDLRGFHVLSKLKSGDLDSWTKLGTEQKLEYRKGLIQTCVNKRSFAWKCEKELDSEIGKNDSASAFFAKYSPNSRKLWDSYFTIGSARSDVTWRTGAPDTLEVSFVKPARAEMQELIKKVVEAAWSSETFQLRIRYQETNRFLGNFFGAGIPHLEFNDGQLSQVNGTGGSLISLDGNETGRSRSFLQTIAHEFGHVLGFKDCYLEFYDVENKVMVNYPLDREDFMCSRAGGFTPHHLDELRRIYSKE